jgi:hypothetical protein
MPPTAPGGIEPSRDAPKRRSIGQLRQPFAALGIRTGGQDRLGRQVRGGGERHRRHRAAHFLGQHAQAFVAQAGAAEFLGDRRADPAHAADFAPEIGSVTFLPVERAPDNRRRAPLRQEAARLVAQLLQVIGKVEVHGDSPFSARCQHAGHV